MNYHGPTHTRFHHNGRVPRNITGKRYDPRTGELSDPPELPPQALDAEKAAIGAMLIDASAIDEVADVLRPEHCYSDANRRIVATIYSMESGIDVVTVGEELQRRGELADIGGGRYLAELMEAVGHTGHARHYAERVVESWRQREMMHAARRLADAASRPDCDMAAALAAFNESRGRFEGGLSGIDYESITSTELDSGDFETKYLIAGMLCQGQPGTLCGGKKTLKTNMLCDMAISLSQAVPFLGRFEVREAVRVGIMSGESGKSTIQETARRVARAKGFSLRDCGNISWAFKLPKIGDPAHTMALEKFIRDNGLAVLLIDPAYLCMPIGDDAGNLFKVGEYLSVLSDITQDTGVTPLLAHHTRKNPVDPFQPAELEDIAWAGFQEWSRQWVLVSRRQKYDPDQGGHHELWLNVGGSAGHSSLWAVNIDEGTRQDLVGRRWEVEVMPAREARIEAAEQAQAAKSEKQEQEDAARRERDTGSVLQAFRRKPDGETKSGIRDLSGVDTRRFTPILASLLEDGTVVTCNIRKGNGRNYEGYRLSTAADKAAPGLTRIDPDNPTPSDCTAHTRIDPL